MPASSGAIGRHSRTCYSRAPEPIRARHDNLRLREGHAIRTGRRGRAHHDDQAIKGDRAYLYFWPGGQTERAAIQLRIGNSLQDIDALTLIVAPLTGAVTVKPGALDLKVPKDDSEASEREDRGL